MQVKWTYHNRESNGVSTLVEHGRVKTARADVTRFSVKSVSNLVISDVTMTDAGLYLCTEDDGFGAKHPVMLSVVNDGNNVSRAIFIRARFTTKILGRTYAKLKTNLGRLYR